MERALQFSFHFEKDEDIARLHEVPAAVLTPALRGIQRIVHLIAMHEEQHEIRAPARVSQDISQRFSVMCQVPIKGSFGIPASIGSLRPDMFDDISTAAVADKFRKVMEAISSGAGQLFRSLVPDPEYRRQILKAAKGASPDPRKGYRFGVHDPNGQRIFDAHDALPHIKEILRQTAELVETASVVTGKFIRMDFEARKLKIEHPETKRILDCFYQDDVESLLLNNPRELIQVVGNVELNTDGIPVRITDVQNILEVDLSPIIVDTIPIEQGSLVARQAIQLSPYLSETKQFYQAEHEELSISLIAFTRDELIDALNDVIAAHWVNYAQENDNALTKGAKELKDRFNEAFEVRP